VAIIAAVALTLRRRKDSKYFDPAAAVKVKASDRLRVVSMKSESSRSKNNVQPAADAAEHK
jgi:NADH-quinone oxidoreductase subunit J